MENKDKPTSIGIELETALSKYDKDKSTTALREYIVKEILDDRLRILDLITIAKISNDTAALVKELINENHVDNTALANDISKVIIADIEKYVDLNLAKYKKYTLDGPPVASSLGESTSQFFNLIGLLKDVSVLGRKLLESAPQFNALKPQSIESPSNLSDQKCSSSNKLKQSSVRDEDATSEDLLAALIESSSSDDFLVLSSSLESITVKDMILAALIYIKSHECFTLSHDIQGVVMVLRRLKFIILNILAPRNQMELITKLLTSIGRYSEMNYVFDLFRDRNQFEILLSKGVEKTPELRIALFNYVKKNPEFYALVTLNFSMFREIAESLEASAIKRLNKVILQNHKNDKIKQQEGGDSKIFKDSSNKTIYSRDSLNLCLVELVDASDCFVKAGCYKRSNDCERKAKLIALQIGLLLSGLNVLDLQQAELTDIISNFESFSEAYIIARAYDCHLAWRQALFKNVILQGNFEYLLSYCQQCDLSSALVEELVLLYKQYINNNQLGQAESSSLAKSMKFLLAKLADVELKCKIYSQLNFYDSKEELLQDSAIQAHLKDLKLA